MRNPTLGKALSLLVHPASLAAIALLLINDHVLRRVWPSALTGKLGDFAWLFFIPFALIALMALLLPAHSARSVRLIPPLAFAAVAAIFGLAKTAQAAHALTVRAAERVFGFPVGWRLDPTDLVALISVALAALLWYRSPAPAARASAPHGAGWVALVMAALLTVANSPAPEPGIYCLEAREREMLAYAGYGSYRSVDGGLTWASLPGSPPSACPNPWSDTSGATVTVEDPADPNRLYRFAPGQIIEASQDAGATWQPAHDPAQPSEAMLAAARKRRANMMERAGPLDGALDRVTGNAVFAMGQAGALVREANGGAWREVAVGQFAPLRAGSAGDAVSLLLGELLLALAVALLALAIFATPTLVRGRGLWIAAVVLGWLIWTVVVFVFSPALMSGYSVTVTFLGLAALGVLLLITTILALVGLAQHRRSAIGPALLVGAAAALLFFLPFVLWAANALPRYHLAAAFGTALAVAAIIAGSRRVWCAPRAPAADASG